MTKEDELVLVVRREKLPPVQNGVVIPDDDFFEELVRREGQFLTRGETEDNQVFQQVIPYIIFRRTENFIGRYFCMQRTENADARLVNRYTLGIGGHVRQTDFQGKTLLDWASREFEEEVEYDGFYEPKTLGLINDDSIPVNRVHVGCVVLLDGSSDRIKIRSDEHSKGFLATLEQLRQPEIYNRMESWSQIVHRHLAG